MTDFSQLGKLIIAAGVVLVVVGAVLLIAGRIPLIGHLPGDISIRRGNVTFYFPIVTMLILSLLLTLILNLVLRR